MKTKAVIFILAMAMAGSAQEPPQRALSVEETADSGTRLTMPERVVSRTEQFRISGGTSLWRGMAALHAEVTKEEFLRLTAENEQWQTPVSIVLHGKENDPLPERMMRLRLVTVDGAAELRLDVHMGRGFNNATLEELRYQVTQALIYERSIRAGKLGNADRNLEVPPWLAEGLREAVAWKQGREDRNLYEALFRHGGHYKLDDLFALNERGREELDGASRAAFVVSAGALVSVLIEQPEGLEGFRSFLDEVASYDGEMPVLLRKHFPEMNLSETSLAKWWALQLANKGGQALMTHVMSVEETEAALEDALRLQLRDAEGIVEVTGLSSWEKMLALPVQDRRLAVRPAQEALTRVSYRCFPSYRPLLVSYQQLLGELAGGSAKNIPFKLAELAQIRETMIRRATRARDFLDYFEISRARNTSGAFEDYMQLKERLKTRSETRTDSISVYLNRMNELFARGLPEKTEAGNGVSRLRPPPGEADVLPLNDVEGRVPVPTDPVPEFLPDIPLDLPR